jgi:hypothetical protein
VTSVVSCSVQCLMAESETSHASPTLSPCPLLALQHATVHPPSTHCAWRAFVQGQSAMGRAVYIATSLGTGSTITHHSGPVHCSVLLGLGGLLGHQGLCHEACL